MSAPVVPIGNVKLRKGDDSKQLVLRESSNELVFAVVGYVGSGTTEIAKQLDQVLGSSGYDVHFLKARAEIDDWAKKNGREPPKGGPNDLNTVIEYQNLGDEMRLTTGDNAAVARAFIRRIREERAKQQKETPKDKEPVKPDGTKRAYILDSLRHPAEANLLRHIYQAAFVLIGVVCDADKRVERLMEKYKNAGQDAARRFMRRDEKAPEKHGQRVSEAFHLSDFFLNNTEERYLDKVEKLSNPQWDISDQLSRLVRLITHSDVVRPRIHETAMYLAYGAQLRSACLSRQVGTALVDQQGNLVSTGTNEVPKAGGGVYGEAFEEEETDSRCAYRQMQEGAERYCSNTREQNAIIDELISEVPALKAVAEKEMPALIQALRQSRIGGLLEFSRAVHAEMDALVTAARKGVSTNGTRAFVTTYPCHYCARHLVSAGVDEVQYIEPYPKSKATSLHPDSITPESTNWVPPSRGGKKVLFRPFTGVAPRMYSRAFLKDRDLKDDNVGTKKVSPPDWGDPWLLGRLSYIQLEAELAHEEA